MAIDFIRNFVIESNMIEGIVGEPKRGVIEAHEKLLACESPTVADVCEFALAMESHAKLRDQVGMDVRVGGYIAPRGGPEIFWRLDAMLTGIMMLVDSPRNNHIAFEKLHPFMDGNGRTGRALWLWQSVRMGSHIPRLSFLHQWYYSTLD